MKWVFLFSVLLSVLVFTTAVSASMYCDSESCGVGGMGCSDDQECYAPDSSGLCGTYTCLDLDSPAPPSCHDDRCIGRPADQTFCTAEGNLAECSTVNGCAEYSEISCDEGCEDLEGVWGAATTTSSGLCQQSVSTSGTDLQGVSCSSIGSSRSFSEEQSCVWASCMDFDSQTSCQESDLDCYWAEESCQPESSGSSVVLGEREVTKTQTCVADGAQCVVEPEPQSVSVTVTPTSISEEGDSLTITVAASHSVDICTYASSSSESDCDWQQRTAGTHTFNVEHDDFPPDTYTSVARLQDDHSITDSASWTVSEAPGANPNVWFTNEPFTCSLDAGDTMCTATIMYGYNDAAGSARVLIDTNDGLQIICDSGSPCSSPGWIRHPDWRDNEGNLPTPPFPRNLEVRSTESPVATAATTIQAECASGLEWSSSQNSCQAPPSATGTLTIPSCEITTVDGTSCTSTASWTTENTNPTTVRLFQGSSYETSTSGSSVDLTLSSTNFPLRHGCSSTSWGSCDSTLTSVTRSASCGETDGGDNLVEENSACVIGTCEECTTSRVCEDGVVTEDSCNDNNCPEVDSWDCDFGCNDAGDDCAAQPTGTLSVGTCEISNQESSCFVVVNWTSDDATNLQLRVDEEMQQDNLLSSGSEDILLSHGENLVELYGHDMGGELRNITDVEKVVSCDDTTEWDSAFGQCVECTEHSECGNLVCDLTGSCVEPELTLNVQVDGEDVLGVVNSCSGAVTADCSVEPSVGLTTTLNITPNCDGSEGDWVCDYGSGYTVTCSLEGRPGITEEQTFTINPEPGLINGTYFYQHSDEIADDITIDVELHGQEDEPEEKVVTDGVYSFETPTPGVYRVISSHPEYDIEQIEPSMVCGEEFEKDLVVAETVCTPDCTSGNGRCNYECLGEEGGCELYDPEFFEDYAGNLSEEFPENTIEAEELIDLLKLQCQGQRPGSRVEILDFPGHYFVCCGSANTGINPCDEDSDCNDGWVCHDDDGYCVPEPDLCSEGDCPPGYSCEEDFCVPPNPPYTPNPRPPIQSYDVLEATVSSDARNLVQFTRLVSYHGMPVRMNVVVVD